MAIFVFLARELNCRSMARRLRFGVRSITLGDKPVIGESIDLESGLYSSCEQPGALLRAGKRRFVRNSSAIRSIRRWPSAYNSACDGAIRGCVEDISAYENIRMHLWKHSVLRQHRVLGVR